MVEDEAEEGVDVAEDVEDGVWGEEDSAMAWTDCSRSRLFSRAMVGHEFAFCCGGKR